MATDEGARRSLRRSFGLLEGVGATTGLPQSNEIHPPVVQWPAIVHPRKHRLLPAAPIHLEQAGLAPRCAWPKADFRHGPRFDLPLFPSCHPRVDEPARFPPNSNFLRVDEWHTMSHPDGQGLLFSAQDPEDRGDKPERHIRRATWRLGSAEGPARFGRVFQQLAHKPCRENQSLPERPPRKTGDKSPTGRRDQAGRCQGCVARSLRPLRFLSRHAVRTRLPCRRFHPNRPDNSSIRLIRNWPIRFNPGSRAARAGGLQSLHPW